MFKIEVPAGAVSVEGTAPGSWTAIFSVSSHNLSLEREIFLSPNKGTNPMRAPPSRPHLTPVPTGGLTSKYTHWGLGQWLGGGARTRTSLILFLK